jgi:YD repeat-containing protein
MSVHAFEVYTCAWSQDWGLDSMKEQVFGSAGSLPSDLITYTYNSDDELTSQNSTLSGTTTFTYDPNGSMLSQVSETPQYRVGLDPSFGNGGTIVSSTDGSIQIGAQTTLANGDILVAGTSNGTLWLAEYKADGSLDTAFHSTGSTTVSLSISPDSIAVGADGSIYAL